MLSGLQVKLCTSPNLPNNEGAWRPIRLTAPAGSIVNPQFPSPGGSRMLIGHYLPVLVFGFLMGIAFSWFQRNIRYVELATALLTVVWPAAAAPHLREVAEYCA